MWVLFASMTPPSLLLAKYWVILWQKENATVPLSLEASRSVLRQQNNIHLFWMRPTLTCSRRRYRVKQYGDKLTGAAGLDKCTTFPDYARVLSEVLAASSGQPAWLLDCLCNPKDNANRFQN